MLSWIRDLKIGTRVLIGMLVPALGLLFFAGASMIDKYETSQELHRVSELAHLAPRISDLVHELQKERGRSAGFIGSKGKNFADSLPAQRTETTARRIEAETALEVFDFGHYDSSLGEAAETALANLDKLGRMRAAVDRFELTVPEMAQYYTGTIMGLLFVRYINPIATALEMVMGVEVFDETVYYFREIPTIVQIPTVIGVALGAMLIAVVASVLPALRAARLHPVEALRYE